MTIIPLVRETVLRSRAHQCNAKTRLILDGTPFTRRSRMSQSPRPRVIMETGACQASRITVTNATIHDRGARGRL